MKRAFKKSLATVLSVLMVVSCCSALFTLFASAENLAFAWADNWTTIDGTEGKGMVQTGAVIPEEYAFSYDYAAACSAGELKIGVKYHGPLSGTAASYGNGNGTNFRVWVRNPSSGFVSYNYFIDVAYDGTGFQNRIFANTNAAGNTSSKIYDYSTAEKPYTVNAVVTADGAEAEIIIPAGVLELGAETQVIVSGSDKSSGTTNYCIHSANSANAPASLWVEDGDLSFIDVWGGEKLSFDGITLGADGRPTAKWQYAVETAPFSYDVNYYTDDTNLYVEIDYTGPINGTATSYGNGGGTNLRIWFYDPNKTIEVEGVATACTTYTNFIDVSYIDGSVDSRFLVNNNPTGNSAGVVYAYGADKPYTISNDIDTDANTWVMRLTMPLAEITASDKFQFQPTVGTKVEGAWNSLTVGTSNSPYALWDDTSALPYAAAYPTEGKVVDADAENLVKTNINLGTTQIDRIEAKGGISHYNGLLNDGVKATDGGGFSYGAPWYTFYTGSDPTLSTIAMPSHIGKATFDLGSLKPIAEIDWQVAPSVGKIENDIASVYASVNNKDWMKIGELTYSGTAVQTTNLVLDKEIIARYVKVEFKTLAMFFMVSEIGIYEYNYMQRANIGNINSYGWGNGNTYPLILAYGEGKTYGEVIGGDNHTWWIRVKAAWDNDANAYVVNAVCPSGSSAAATWVMGEKEFIIISYSGNTDTASRDAIADLVVGDKLYAYNFDFTQGSSSAATSSVYFTTHKAATIMPGEFTDVDVPQYSTPTNVASALVNEVPPNATYNGNIIDGITGTSAYNNKWRAYTKGTSASVIDLGEVYTNIGSARAHIWTANKSGIVKPDSVKFFASLDGDGWLEIGELDLSDELHAGPNDTPVWESVQFAKLVKARYIKMEVATSGSFTFISEVEVNALTEIVPYSISSTYTYATDSTNLISYKMGATIDEVNPDLKNHEWWNFATLVWDNVAKAYKVTAINIGTGDKATTDFGSLEIPTGGFVIGSHQQATDFANFIASLAVGDALYLYGADIDALTAAGTALTNVFVTKAPVSELTPFAPKTVRIKNFVAFAGGDVSIFTRITKADSTVLYTIDDIASYVRGCEIGNDTDYNYYTLIVVGADNVVTEVNLNLGRETGLKGATVVPEGGYVIAVNEGAAAAEKALFKSILVGDTIHLFNVDLDALAQNDGAIIVEDDPLTEDVDESSVTPSTVALDAGAYLMFEHIHNWSDPAVVEPTCTEEGKTTHICTLCGEEETIEGTVVPALGHEAGAEVFTKNPDCIHGGYDYTICTRCNEELPIEGTETPATGIHDYVASEVNAIFTIHECSVCDEYYYTATGSDTLAVDIKVSHHQNYSWAAFEVMLLSGEGKTAPQIQANVKSTSYIVYVVEKVGDYYVATEYYKNQAEVLTVTAPANGFLMFVDTHCNAYNLVDNEAILGNALLLHDIDLSAAFGIDTGWYPAKHIFALPIPAADFTAYNTAVAAANALTEADYTAESWAALTAALAVDVSAKKLTEQADVTAATTAINAAILALEEAQASVVYGDLNGDGEATMDDVLLALQAAAKKTTLTDEQNLAADVNGDGEFTMDDALTMLQFMATKISVWPREAV